MPYDFSNPLVINQFDGGKTDNYLDGPRNAGQEFDNVYIGKDLKIFSRPGRTFYISSAAAGAQIPAGNQRISALIKHNINTTLLIASARKLYYNASGTITAISGPVSTNDAFSANATTNYLSWSDWRGHTFITSDSYCDPVKVYKDENGTHQVRTAGMPEITLEGAIDLANDLKAKYNLHRVQGTRHATNDTTNIVSNSDAYDFDTLVTLVTELSTDLNAHFTDAALGAAWAYHGAQESPTSVLASTAAVTTLAEILTRLDDIKTKYNQHDANGTTHAAGTARQVSVTRLPSISAGAGTGTYIYAFLYHYQYYVGGVLHEDFGPTTQVTLSSADTGTKSISQIPTISNGTTRCYDTSTIKVYIYRTANAGTAFYYVGSVTNGTTTYSDTTSDATLVLNSVLYTTGGVKDNDPPPRAKFFTAVNDIGVYSGLKIGTQEYPNSFITSIPGDVDSVPGDFQDEIEVAVTGSSSVQIYPILFGRTRMYRLEGIIDEQGRGTIFKREVSRNIGCISNNSIVQIPQGLVWAGEDGFYFSDGFQPPQMISSHLVDSYNDLISTAANEKKIYGEYDNAENRVLWACQSNSSNSDNDTVYVLDLNFPLSPKSVFTTHSGQGTAFRPTALAFFGRTMVQADSRGYLFKYDASTTTDPKVVTTVAASAWTTYAVIYNYKSCADSFGINTNYKYVPLITLEAKNDVNTTISIKANKNDSGGFVDLKEIRSRDQITWGDPSIIWNDPNITYYWNIARIITAKRRMPAGNLRVMMNQLQITNAYTNIFRSDDYASATIDATLKTATLSGVNWPTDIADYYISFETDSYAHDYLITSRDSATAITFSDSTNLSTTGSKKWIIRGYKKGETIYLLSYGVRFAIIGSIQTTYKGDDFENA